MFKKKCKRIEYIDNTKELENAWLVMFDSRRKSKLAQQSLLDMLKLISSITILNKQDGKYIVTNAIPFVDTDRLDNKLKTIDSKNTKSIYIPIQTDKGYEIMLSVKYPELTKKESSLYSGLSLEKNDTHLTKKEIKDILDEIKQFILRK